MIPNHFEPAERNGHILSNKRKHSMKPGPYEDSRFLTGPREHSSLPHDANVLPFQEQGTS